MTEPIQKDVMKACVLRVCKQGLLVCDLCTLRELLIQNDSAKVLSGSQALSKADFTSNLVKYCVTVIGTLPILLVYPFVQKYFVKGVTLGGVKG